MMYSMYAIPQPSTPSTTINSTIYYSNSKNTCTTSTTYYKECVQRAVRVLLVC